MHKVTSFRIRDSAACAWHSVRLLHQQALGGKSWQDRLVGARADACMRNEREQRDERGLVAKLRLSGIVRSESHVEGGE